MESRVIDQISGGKLTFEHMKVLQLAAKADGHNVSDVAAFMRVSNAAASKTVDKLVRAKLLRRGAVIPKNHQSAFSRLAGTQIETLASILREVLQRLDNTVVGAPYNLLLFDRPYMRKREGYWKTIEDDFHWHLQILPQIVRPTGFERGSWFYYNPVPPEIAARCLSA